MHSLTTELQNIIEFYNECQSQGSPQVILDEIKDYENRLRKAIDIIENGE